MTGPVMTELRSALSTDLAPYLLLGAYLLGSIPFGYLLARFVAKKDVRASGSGNIGATNVARVVGKKLGILTLVLDAAKGAVPVLAVGPLLAAGPHQQILEAMAGLFAFLGHCFPVWLKLRGGKGVATGAGALAAHQPLIFGIGFLTFAAIYAFSKVVSLSSLAAALVVIAAVLVLLPLDAALLPLLLMFAILILRHQSNIRRLLNKEELKV